MARALLANNATTTIATTALTTTATSITLTSGAAFPSPSGGQYFYCTVTDGTNIEIVKCTARASNTLTVVRAQEGTGTVPNTTGYAFAVGSKVSLNLTALTINELAPLTGEGASGTWGISISGNAATATLASTVTTNANLTGGVTSVGNAATVVTNANLTGPITSVGNATAVASQTGTGTKFVMDTGPTVSNLTATGTTTIANATLTGTNAISNATLTGTNAISNVTLSGTNALGTPSSLTLTNATGLPIVAGTTGTLSVARGGTGATDAATARKNLQNTHYIGTWSSGTTYFKNQVVNYASASYIGLYISLTDSNTNNAPGDGVSNSNWVCMLAVASGSGGGGGSGPTCYVPETLILMADGRVLRADQVVVGDLVVGLSGVNRVTKTARVRLGAWRRLYDVGGLRISGEHNMWVRNGADEYWAVADYAAYVFERTVLGMQTPSGEQAGLLARAPYNATSPALEFATTCGWRKFDVQALDADPTTELVEIATDGSHSLVADGVVVGAVVTDDFDYGSARWTGAFLYLEEAG